MTVAVSPPQDVTPASAGSFQTVDITTHVDAADQGNVEAAMLKIDLPTIEYDVQVRHPSSTDALGNIQMEDDTHVWMTTAVNASDQFECHIDSTAVTVLLLGYMTSDEATFETSRVDVTPATTGTAWNDFDTSTYLASGDEGGIAFFDIDSDTSQWYDVGLRANNAGATVGLNNDLISRQGGWSATDANGVCEIRNESSTTNIYYRGCLHADAVGTATTPDGYTATASDNTYDAVDISSTVGTDAVHAFWCMYYTGGSEIPGDVRETGETRDGTNRVFSRGSWGFTTVDDLTNEIEVARGSTLIDLYVGGWSTAPTPSGTVTVGTTQPSGAATASAADPTEVFTGTTVPSGAATATAADPYALWWWDTEAEWTGFTEAQNASVLFDNVVMDSRPPDRAYFRTDSRGPE